ncbi:hypothetical protein KQ51_01570 [Candidatus Izimaplasma bacterium HR1]|jgi:hypothetical protein|uniref:hypothetical protein n=1 Tax=Candidatus Izimoplasma sp. HR1 TaxID=1541959 RepID=UPI0004F721EC|nr:hypothetical protein KQ51_01570 [Candidatus Izimaplasma bacterium HR1]
MNNYSSTIESISHNFDEKKQKKLQTDLFSRLCKKLEEKSDQDIDQLIKTTYELLRELSSNEEVKPKAYLKSLNVLRNNVKTVYDYTYKGQIEEQYTGMGIAIGVAIGAGFTAISPAFIGVGIPIGLVLGISIGRKKDQEAEKLGKTY